MEISELGFYMLLTCAFAALVRHPASPVRHAIPSSTARRALMGVGMGLAIIAIVVSPWGKQSGGHFNPAITVTFYHLGKVEFWDAWFYVIALIAFYITFETPLSGMSTNPARTFGSAFHADYWRALWIYFLAPSLGMLFAAEAFLWMRKGAPPFCAKLHHANNKRCIFHHG